ncbi:nuclear transport factor 2 family protein [Actinomadura sp. 7K507]|uniref:nuclear transport factor 2 family protein n=1 Tax=Actinomadura sp. 7K507 TaxID=2530365 RepID=UPI00104AA1EE|nr:nuclear transport factor 2 family protein [Actinomadura sp. 7K507]TDC81160.1 hypothetical protein E1285_33250 [Actinomadura sp. 7K507]
MITHTALAARTASLNERWRAGMASPIALGVVAVVLATFGVWALRQADAVRDDPSARNTALTDGAATSEVKGAVADMIGKIFSFNYTDPARTRDAAKASLTGDAVQRYETIFGRVRAEAPEAKSILSTRVTGSAVTSLRGDRAGVLVFADQRTTRTTDGTSTNAPAMLAVTAVRRDGRWKITSLDTFAGR